MKKLLLVLAAAFAMVACQTDINEVGVVADGVAAVEFEVGTPQMRAYSDGSKATQLQYAVYEVKADQSLDYLEDLTPEVPLALNELKANVRIELATNKNYAVIFWAAAPGAPYTFVPAEKKVTVNYNGATCNDENRDAFYAYKEFEVRGAAAISVVLRRPFAQVNVGASDVAEAAKSNFVPSESQLVVKNVYSTLNLVYGTASDDVAEVTFAAAAVPTGETFPVTGYDYLAMSYVLVGKDQAAYDVTYTIEATDGTVISNTVGAVPMRANYRTNIYGKLLTSSTDINVEINPDYNLPNNATEAWDGQTIKEPVYDVATKTYSISCASELAYIAQLVNGTLDTDNVSRAAVAANSLKGCTVKLENNIALNGMEWTPIGNGNNHFMGTFDGNHKTISGLKVTKRGDDRAALFGTVSGTVVFRNLTISDAEVRCPDFKGDFYGSALIGTAYGFVTIENVDIVDSYLSGNNKVGALIAHDGVMNTLTVSGCDVSGTTFEATDAADCGSVGGLLGYFQTGGEHHITNCSVKGCTFNVVNSTNTGKRANGLLFGGIDSKAGQKLYINGAVIENNTWNEKFYVDGVEVTEGKFVSPYGGLIGGERDDNAEGELYINDELFVLPVATAEDLKKAIANKVSTIKVIGEIDLADVVLSGYNGTIVGVDDSACLNTRNFVPGPNEAYSLRCTNIAFQNIDFKLPTHSNYYTTGFVGTGDISFENCDFEGSTVLNSANAAATNWTFTECNFVSVESGAYASWVYAGTKATFNECRFAGVDRAAKIYGDGGEVEVEYNDCTFTSSTLNKSGVEIDSSHTTINAAFNNCSQIGMAGLYAVKGDKATVIVDGVAQQMNNQIFYTATTLVHAHFYKDKFGEGTDLVSNVWDETTGKGVITLSGDVTKIGSNAFYYDGFHDSRENLISISLPNTVTEIGEDAFDQCPNLTTVEFNNNLKVIGEGAFGGCAKLTNVVLPESLTTIGNSAFNSCTSLKSITIPAGVTSIGSYAFNGIKEIKVYCKPTTPPTVGSTPFNQWWAEIYVPTASLADYQSAWGSVVDNIYDGKF